MNYSEPISDTFLPVEDDIDFNGPYADPILLMSTASARIYRISKAGKTMLLKTPVDASGRTLELLKREYRMGVALNHPNVVAIYTWETSSPVGPGILMEYIDGRTLSAFLEEKPTLSARRRVFGQLLDAVNYIHKHGVTHNDLKPTNIMVSRANGDVKIIDFGLADIDGEMVQRQLGGTAGYASPELASRDNDADTRSDIYSLGVIMRDIFGRRYSHIWQKCMAKNPQKRYRNVDSLIKAWRWRLRRPAIAGSIAALIAVAALVWSAAIRMERLKRDVEHYSLSAVQLGDTISALRFTQTVATDSISHLNSKLILLNKEKATEDSLVNDYTSRADAVIGKYKGIVQKLRCVEETYILYKMYNADMDSCDAAFLRESSSMGQMIFDQYGLLTRLRGTTQLETEARRLPMLDELTDDLDEMQRVIPLILSGQPWSLRSDTAKD